MSDFEKEDRYIVIKLKNLTHMQEKHLRACLYGEGIQTIESVVVEHDWPEYHMVWSMLQHRMAGKTVPDFDIWRSADALQQRLAVAEQRNVALEAALKFYADGDHLLLADADAWDTCSGEPINFLHDEAGTASVEDGSIAKAALKPAEAAAPIDDQWEK